ncbi:MAG TPA: NADH-quinone oxidoreductase subunit F [Firmicutes bacterium]|nr:4Fe-4S binding protein [Bacillota bacterium]HAA34861.1 NADH-quinone oxidoreductase subunit F [Bacillota bacterium]
MNGIKNKLTLPEDVESLREKVKDRLEQDRPCLVICGDTGCTVCGSRELVPAFEEALKERGLAEKVKLKVTGCLGFCERGPLVLVFPGATFYQKVQVADAAEIVEKTVLQGEIIESLLYADPDDGRKIACAYDIPFYKLQTRVLLETVWHIDPLDILDYIAHGGYSALAKVLGGMTPQAVIAEMKEARLRGRGGAGFMTGLKWEFCRAAGGDEKYILCNADEGDPGAFMDRSLLEGNPHAVLEGMMIAAYAVGAREGIIYIRIEYPTAVFKIEQAVRQARELGLLGKNILGTGFDFEVQISKGAGAFVCGEETALVRAAEGKVGEPRQKPPFPAEAGFRGKPTVINNVETFVNVPLIINRGAAAYHKIGTESSGGTKIFCLVGKVRNTGLVEVPFGTTLREIIFGIGGGIKDGKGFKAVQTGGPSGGCLPEEMLDLKVDFNELAQAGSIMGSGGMIVMDEETCVVDVARYFLQFLKSESCGKCFSCRVGIQRMLEIFDRITTGNGSPEDLELLEELALTVKDTSMCGLGQTSANPVLSTLRYFRDEYLAHIRDKRCPAGVCRSLFRYRIDQELCAGCGSCAAECQSGAIVETEDGYYQIIPDRCTRCGVCMETCGFEAITKD